MRYLTILLINLHDHMVRGCMLLDEHGAREPRDEVCTVVTGLVCVYYKTEKKILKSKKNFC